MKHRSLGRTGIQVSPLCLGAMTFGAWGHPDHDTSIAAKVQIDLYQIHRPDPDTDIDETLGGQRNSAGVYSENCT